MPTIPDQPFTNADLPRLGISRRELRGLLTDGVLRRPLRGVFVDAALDDCALLRAQCAKLALPGHVVVADASAAWLRGIDLRDVAADRVDGRILEVVSVDGHEPTRRPGVLGGKRDLLPTEITEIHGIAATTTLRTAADLACLRGRPTALAALDAFMNPPFGLTNDDYAEVAARRFRGRRGCTQLRALAPLARAGAESVPESWTRCKIIDAGLPEPEMQVEVEVPGFGLVRLDLAYRRPRIAVEYDGEEHHTSEEDRAHDLARRRALDREGWLVIVVTKDLLSGPGLERWLDELRQSLAERTRPSRRRHAVGGSTWRPARRW